MDRKIKLTLKMRARELDMESIVTYITKTLALLVTQPKSLRFKSRCQEIHILKRELQTRGFIVFKHVTPFGMAIAILGSEPIALALPDHKAMSPCSMEIPSITTILSLPLPSDLPKHGYLV